MEQRVATAGHISLLWSFVDQHLPTDTKGIYELGMQSATRSRQSYGVSQCERVHCARDDDAFQILIM
eukprot:8662030-Karenia_brevis.AAC.1